jgi:hypothetical protein
MRAPAAGDRKFRELILYVAAKAEPDPNFGATKLNKILFYCDFLAYRSLGKAISGQAYQKLPHGPAPRTLLPVISEMESAEECIVVEREHFGYTQKRLVPRRGPDLSVFTPEEVDLINGVVMELWQNNASSVSELSHRFIGWQAVGLGEEIPYETVFVGDPAQPLTAEELDHARELWEEVRESSSYRP